ncbi:MAG: hypothetical protein IJ575_04275 [Selenomonadaceae bacterium]|nr:hypothetical protein [Selenomonadaceae bacterium]
MPLGNNIKQKSRLRQCAECGKVFYSLWNYTVCDKCRAKINDKEEQIREFVMKNCNATIIEIAEEFEVSVNFVRRMIDEGKLDLKKTVTIRCHGCGAEIATGNYCAKCRDKMKHQIEAAKERILENMRKQGKIDGGNLNRKTADKVRSDFRRK